MKRVFIILLASLLLFCGAGAADVSPFSVNVFDASAGNNPISLASVTLTGTSSSTLYTTADGIAEFKDVTYPETYTVKVAKTGYITQTRTISIVSANSAEPFYLMPESPILITVSSSEGKPVSGAEVTVNKVSVGKTDANGRLHAAMNRGSYNTVEVSAPSYVSYTAEEYLRNDATSLPIVLSLSRVNPLILVYAEDKEPVSGAAVYVNGELTAYTDAYGKAQLSSYVSGKYTLTVDAKNFVAETKAVNFTEDESAVTVELKYATSTLTVKTLADGKPIPDTIIYFDGDVKGITNTQGIYTTASAPDTKIYISASHDGYSAESITYTVAAGADNTVIIEMQKNVPVVLIGIGILAVFILILILALVISGRRRKPIKSPAKSYPPTQKRDSF